VYSPYDLGPREGKKWSSVKLKPSRDVFEMIGEEPMKFYKVGYSHTPWLDLTLMERIEYATTVYVRVGDWTHKAFECDGAEGEDTAEDGEGCEKGNWMWHYS